MLEKFSNWWNRDRIAIEQLSQRCDSLQTKIADQSEQQVELEQVNEQQETELKMFREQAEADRQRREGSDPWVEVTSADYSAAKGIQVNLDWNEAFVKYLRDNGFDGDNDEVVVQKWLLLLYRDMAMNMEDEQIEQTDFHAPNEFE